MANRPTEDEREQLARDLSIALDTSFSAAMGAINRIGLESMIAASCIPREYFLETPRQFASRWYEDGIQLKVLIERLEKAKK